MDAAKVHYRTVWISDLHIGARGFKAAALLAFLKSVECDQLYLVGDIFDLLAIRRQIHWDADSTSIIRRLLKMSKRGTVIWYLPGNHDGAIRHFVPHDFDNIHVVNETVHITADGRRMLVLHGDQFDFVTMHLGWLANFGSWIYDRLLQLNDVVHWIRSRCGRKHWSLSAWLKFKAKQAVSLVRDFESAASAYAIKLDCDGVIMGHIHTAALHQHIIDGILYANCGDWVESCTALVEHADGRLELITAA